MDIARAVDPRFVDLALALLALEGASLVGWRLWTGRGPAPLGALANLTAGGALLVAARAGLAGAGASVMLAALATALVAHGCDLALRWERKPSGHGESIARTSPARGP